MLVYLLKSGACLAILFLFYKLFLEKENMHVFKRFYLLTALLFSLIVPTLVFVEYVEAPATMTHTVVQQLAADSDNVINVPAALETDILDFAPLLWGIYFLGLLFFGITFIKNLFQIFRRIRRNPKQISARFTQVLLLEKITPHTFFRYIFLNKKKFESNEIPKEVLLHEETHARQKHSLDVVFVEMLQVIFWFNPFIYLFKKAVKLNHEFLADHAVLKNNIDTTAYQNTLLSYLSPDSQKKYQPILANSINYSSIKKRFTVMKKQTSKKSVLFRSLLLLPLLAILLYGFTETIIIQKEAVKNKVTVEQKEGFQEKATAEMVATHNTLAKKYNLQPKEHRIIPSKDLEILEHIYGLMTKSQKKNALSFPECPPQHSPIQEGATTDQISEYNALAKKYNAMIRKNWNIRIKHAEVEHMQYIYGIMTDDQKTDAEPFPDFPPMPDVPTPPSAPRVNKGEASAIPPPPVNIIEKDGKSTIPPPPPPTPTPDQVEKYVNNIIETQEIIAEEKVVELVGGGVRHNKYSQPEPPPPPKSPLDHVIEMAKKDAVFYHEGKEITSDKAIQILKNSTKINIDTRRSNSDRPVVRLSSKPIIIEN
ncbi:Regulatory sensor-transducer, BlaR1/MecR1 family / TonB-dependent receptor [hydrothermal vent metagenome]|uniref:Regulatory sensor-transducer, BlaR1/MecR1 family / TonB-dependent receptor n=1 Tax=hydrothermal vent metagenome TaxID=652676 RepID=A0A3B0TU24_9ZZZZ